MVEPSQSKINKYLKSDKKTYKGLEKENLRSDNEGKISNKPFPSAFGIHNFNRYVTLDYSEPHLELVTPPFESNSAALDFLSDLHGFVENNLDGDLLWNYSMPPKFKSKYIKLPHHRNCNTTKLAHLYRLGLRNRYGDKMQSTAGIHFNFSLSESAITSINESKTNIYLGMSRNLLRLFPIVLRLIGCSPVAHKSFMKGRKINIETMNEDDCCLPKSTSLRVSRLGYYSEEQDENFITFNSLKDYLSIIRNYINKPNKKFQNISLDLKQQVNNGTIQMESELYNHIRPKGVISRKVRPYNQLKENGIEYLELRSIDLNPYSTIGISLEDIEFLELLCLYCVLSESPDISLVESEVIKENIRRSSESGQGCNFINSLESVPGEVDAKDMAESFLNKLQAFSKEIGLHDDRKDMFDEYFKRNENPLSERLIEDIKKHGGVLGFILKQSKHTHRKIDNENLTIFQNEKEISETEYEKHKKQDDIIFEEYLENFRGAIR